MRRFIGPLLGSGIYMALASLDADRAPAMIGAIVIGLALGWLLEGEE